MEEKEQTTEILGHEKLLDELVEKSTKSDASIAFVKQLMMSDSSITEESANVWVKTLEKLKVVATATIQQNELNRKRNKLSIRDMYTVICKTCDVVIARTTSRTSKYAYEYYIYDARYKTYVNSSPLLYEFTTILCNIADIDDTNRTFINLDARFRGTFDSSLVKWFNPAPTNVINFANGYYDLYTKTFVEHESDEAKAYSHYHYTKRIPWRYVDKPNPVYSELVKRVFMRWSQDDDETFNFLREIVYATIEGNGRKRWIILKSGGGDGKSTFMYILEKLIGSHQTVKLNIHDLTDDNAVNQVNETVGLVAGDDLSSDYTLSSKATARFKSLVAYETFQANMKYGNNVNVHTTAVMIQGTNSELKIRENSAAMRDRILTLNWLNYNFRESPETAFDLDKLVGKKGTPNAEFYEALIFMVLDNMDYFESYHVSERMKQDTINTVDGADTVYQYMLYMDDAGLMENPVAIPELYYKAFKCWSKDNSEASSTMTYRSFTTRFNKLLEDKFDYVKTTDDAGNKRKRFTLSAITPLECDIEAILNKFKHHKLTFNIDDSRFFACFNDDYNVDKAELTKYRKLVEESADDIDVSNPRVKRILRYLAKYEQNSFASSILGTN